jgi:hypothetical protein
VDDYGDKQVVGIDLHRRRTVMVRMTQAGEAPGHGAHRQRSGPVAAEIAKAGEATEVVLDVGAVVHLAHPLGV